MTYFHDFYSVSWAFKYNDLQGKFRVALLPPSGPISGSTFGTQSPLGFTGFPNTILDRVFGHLALVREYLAASSVKAQILLSVYTIAHFDLMYQS